MQPIPFNLSSPALPEFPSSLDETSHPYSKLWNRGVDSDSSDSESEQGDPIDTPSTPNLTFPTEDLPATPLTTFMPTDHYHLEAPTTPIRNGFKRISVQEDPHTPVRVLTQTFSNHMDREFISPQRAKTAQEMADEIDLLSPISQKRKIDAISSAMQSVYPPGSVKSHRTAATLLNQESHWARRIAFRFNFFPPKPLNLLHIVSGEAFPGVKGRGHHAQINSSYEIKEEFTNPKTQVKARKWKESATAQWKFSSFFPEWLNSEEKIKEYLEGLTPYAMFGNRELFCDEKYNIWVETYGRKTVVSQTPEIVQEWVYSAFPLFSVQFFQSSHTFIIYDGLELSSDEVLSIARASIEEYLNDSSSQPKTPIRYQTESEVLIDIAFPLVQNRPYIPKRLQNQSKLEKGICFWFPSSLFNRTPSSAPNETK